MKVKLLTKASDIYTEVAKRPWKAMRIPAYSENGIHTSETQGHTDGDRTEDIMSVSGVSTGSTYGMTAYEQGKTYSRNAAEETTDKTTVESGVVYESSVKNDDRSSIIAQLKADTEARVNNFKNMVTDMLNKQGLAVKNSDDIWRLLAKGNYTVDAKTAQEAKDAISEDGYWGVNKTAERMFEFAKAYAGDDEAKMEKMMNAFEKGFKQAENIWGGKLPNISYQTYDRMQKLYDEYKSGSAAVEE